MGYKGYTITRASYSDAVIANMNRIIVFHPVQNVAQLGHPESLAYRTSTLPAELPSHMADRINFLQLGKNKQAEPVFRVSRLSLKRLNYKKIFLIY